MRDVTTNESSHGPVRHPTFTDTIQIGIVVRDLDATLRRYVDDYGIGPWEVHEFNPANAKDLREYDRPAQRSWRLAVTMVGHVMWELIEPLDNESVYARFLAEKGEGVHHIAVATPSFDSTVEAQAKRGKALVLSGTFSGVKVAYLPTDGELGVIMEIFSGAPRTQTKRDARQPDKNDLGLGT
ncbi:MAG: VOC family protein [Betaproteobacteria bacterium]